jgi:hypothetical protein
MRVKCKLWRCAFGNKPHEYTFSLQVDIFDSEFVANGHFSWVWSRGRGGKFDLGTWNCQVPPWWPRPMNVSERDFLLYWILLRGWFSRWSVPDRNHTTFWGSLRLIDDGFRDKVLADEIKHAFYSSPLPHIGHLA